MKKCDSAGVLVITVGLLIGIAGAQAGELDVRRIPHEGVAAEFYFSPDGKSIIGNAKLEGDEAHYVYTMDVESGAMVKINGKGEDACSHYFPDGERLIWTSTRDLTNLPPGSYSDPANYPTGAELYSSALDGSDVKRLTNNKVYDAEVAVSPDGKWILWARQIDGEVDLWRMPADGRGEEQQITHTLGEQEGGAFYLPDSETVLFRSWDRSVQGQRGMPMTIYTINHDGTGKKQVSTNEGTNWAPYPAPDGVHYAYVRFLPPHNFEIFLGNLETGEDIRLTHNDSFDGFPSISTDGKMMTFSSSRQAAPGERVLHQYIMDLSSLDLGPK